MIEKPVIVITGSSRGIGRYLTEYYSNKGFKVFGCSRGEIDYELENYRHFIDSVKKEKPDTIKGEFIKNIFITSTMGISYKIRAK